jgi:hypothetical protein
MKFNNAMKHPVFTGLPLLVALSLHAAPVTFHANMSYQAELGNFAPGSHTVEARGTFNSWASGFVLTNVPGTTNYQNTIEITNAAGSTVEHKFWHSGGAGTYESGDNRRFVLTGSAQTVSRYFNDAWGGGSYTVTMTFQVDMGPRVVAGSFDPATDSVEVRGGFNGWAGGVSFLTNNSANVYTNTFEWIESRAPGAPIEYKFYASPAGLGWESDPNRSYPISQTPQVVPVDCFNRACASRSKPESTSKWT